MQSYSPYFHLQMHCIAAYVGRTQYERHSIRLHEYIWCDSRRKIHLNRGNNNNIGDNIKYTYHIVQIHNRSLSTNTNFFSNLHFRECVYAYVPLRQSGCDSGGSGDHIDNKTIVYRFNNKTHVNTCHSVPIVCVYKLCVYFCSTTTVLWYSLSLDEWMRTEMTQCVSPPAWNDVHTMRLYDWELSSHRSAHGFHTVCECSHEQKQKAEAQQ